jgi:DUF1680 family protein
MHTRRDALKLVTAAAALGCAGARAALEPPGPAAGARYFPLADVRLDAGPFLDAQRLDAAYLLTLEPDRLLHNFRVNAGLAPKAPVYGGWESQQPWVDIRCQGHTLGHFLGACSSMFAACGDQAFAGRVDYIVAELRACQDKCGAGWLSAFPDGVAPLVDSLAGRPFAGVPWYTAHKILAGLRDAHTIRGSRDALEVLLRFAAWIESAAASVSDPALQKMLDREHGGMNEVLADLAALNGDGRFLALAQRFSHRALLDPLSRGEDPLDGLHANTQIPKVIGFSRIHELGGDPRYQDAATFFWSTVVRTRSFATGGHGDGEHFFPKDQFAQHLGSAKTMETCCTHNMLRLTRALYAQDPQPAYFNYFERALFNGILASQDPDSGMMTYFQSTRPGYVKLYHTPFDSFWCCTGSGMENHARYGESIYARDADTLSVNLFVASILEWRELDLTVRQITRFPDEDRSVLHVSGKGTKSIGLRIRHPAWCEQMTVKVNGRHAYTHAVPGAYFRLPGEGFRAGDLIAIHTPMKTRLEPLPGAPEYVALMHGPLVLAARLGTHGITPGADLIVNERTSGEMLDEPVDIPRWLRPVAELPASLRRTNESRLTFVSRDFAGRHPVEFIPWFRIAHERYNLYWRASA